MGFFGKMFGKNVNKGKAEMAKVQNRDLMQAIVGGSMLVDRERQKQAQMQAQKQAQTVREYETCKILMQNCGWHLHED